MLRYGKYVFVLLVCILIQLIIYFIFHNWSAQWLKTKMVFSSSSLYALILHTFMLPKSIFNFTCSSFFFIFVDNNFSTWEFHVFLYTAVFTIISIYEIILFKRKHYYCRKKYSSRTWLLLHIRKFCIRK